MKFYKNLILLSALFVVLIALAQSFMGWYQQGFTIWYTLAFFIVLNIVSYQYTIAGRKMENNRFVSRFLLTTGIRIIFCAFFLAIYLIINEQRDQVFVVTFMMLYLFYTLFEIYHLVTKLRPEKTSEVESTNH